MLPCNNCMARRRFSPLRAVVPELNPKSDFPNGVSMLAWLRDPLSRLGRSEAAAPAGRAGPDRGMPAVEAKASKAGAIIALHSAGRPVWTPRTYAALARAGYMKNPVVYRAVRMVSEAAASLPWLLYEGPAELDDHPLLTLLKQPNPHQGGADFFEALYGHLLVSGNAYVEAVAAPDAGGVLELYALRPDRMSVVPDASGWPAAFEYAANGRVVRFAQEGEGRISPILHMREFHPLDDYYGFPPLEAAQVSLDVHNAANAWNKALLDNAARPSGALVYKGENGANLSEEQFTCQSARERDPGSACKRDPRMTGSRRIDADGAEPP
jgi:phage portal protein BeeE